MSITEATVEAATLGWFDALGYDKKYGPDLEPGELYAERKSFGDVVLLERLRAAVARINPTFPADATEEAIRKITRT